jgi:AcrR family transcriptional regulator
MVSRQEEESSTVRRRTRRAIIDAASRLIAEGVLPTVGAAAQAAEVSRATAYRYFPTQQALLVEARLQAAVEPPDASAATAITDPAERVVALVQTVSDWAYEHESHLRLLLRMSLERDGDGETAFRRPATRLGLIDQSLASLEDRLSDQSLARLRNALALLFGIDPVVTFTDICRIPRTEAQEVLTWAARTLIRGAMNDEDDLERPQIVSTRAESPV